MSTKHNPSEISDDSNILSA